MYKRRQRLASNRGEATGGASWITTLNTTRFFSVNVIVGEVKNIIGSDHVSRRLTCDGHRIGNDGFRREKRRRLTRRRRRRVQRNVVFAVGSCRNRRLLRCCRRAGRSRWRSNAIETQRERTNELGFAGFAGCGNEGTLVKADGQHFHNVHNHLAERDFTSTRHENHRRFSRVPRRSPPRFGVASVD